MQVGCATVERASGELCLNRRTSGGRDGRAWPRVVARYDALQVISTEHAQ